MQIPALAKGDMNSDDVTALPDMILWATMETGQIENGTNSCHKIREVLFYLSRDEIATQQLSLRYQP